MALVHLLYYSAVSYNINICIVHTAGVNNEIADCLSHFNLTITLCSGITNGLLQAPESVFSGIHLSHIKWVPDPTDSASIHLVWRVFTASKVITKEPDYESIKLLRVSIPRCHPLWQLNWLKCFLFYHSILSFNACRTAYLWHPGHGDIWIRTSCYPGQSQKQLHLD